MFHRYNEVMLIVRVSCETVITGAMTACNCNWIPRNQKVLHNVDKNAYGEFVDAVRVARVSNHSK